MNPVDHLDSILSILIDNRSSSAFLNRTIESIVAQRFFTGRCQVFVLESGTSSRSTHKLINAYADVSSIQINSVFTDRNSLSAIISNQCCVYMKSSVIADSMFFCQLLTFFKENTFSGNVLIPRIMLQSESVLPSYFSAKTLEKLGVFHQDSIKLPCSLDRIPVFVAEKSMLIHLVDSGWLDSSLAVHTIQNIRAYRLIKREETTVPAILLRAFSEGKKRADSSGLSLTSKNLLILLLFAVFKLIRLFFSRYKTKISIDLLQTYSEQSGYYLHCGYNRLLRRYASKGTA